MNNDLSRRQFLGKLLAGIGVLLAALIGIPVVGFVIAPIFTKRESRWIPIAWLEDLKSTGPQEVQFTFFKLDAWYRASVKQSVYVLHNTDDNFIVFSSTCTHLGCTVHWDSSKNRFLCPCHGGQFDINGKVVAGPPPKPLKRFDTKIENGRLFIKSV